MEPDLLERRLALVERQIGQEEQHAAMRRDCLAGLETAGRGTSDIAGEIRDHLHWTENKLRMHRAEREWLLGQLRR